MKKMERINTKKVEKGKHYQSNRRLKDKITIKMSLNCFNSMKIWKLRMKIDKNVLSLKKHCKEFFISECKLSQWKYSKNIRQELNL